MGIKGVIRLLIKHIFRKLYVIADISRFEPNRFQDTSNLAICEGAFVYADATIVNTPNNRYKIVIGYNTHVRGTLLVFSYGGNIKIGENCYVGDLTRIWSADSISIGDNVLISHNVNIMDTNSHQINAEERKIHATEMLNHGMPTEKFDILTAPITIHSNVWINFNVIILKGVTIGEGAIIGAGSVVTKDVPPYSFVAGNPAVIKKYLNEE